METHSKRRKTEPVVEKIRRGEVSVFVALAEELPDVFRTHVVPKLDHPELNLLAEVCRPTTSMCGASRPATTAG